jgi:hypothetical protein
MKKMLMAAAFAAATTMIIAAPASAAVVLSFSPSPAYSPGAGYTVVDDFSSLAGLTGITGSVEIKTPPSDGDGAPPANSFPAGTSYLSVLGGGSATYNFASPVSAFEFDWGSIDSYNTLTINASDGTFTVIPGTTTGLTPFPNAANGDQVAPGTNGLFQVASNSGETFNSITFASSSNSFEIDNLATAVPEPATWAMMILGLGGIGAMLRRRRGFLAPQTA